MGHLSNDAALAFMLPLLFAFVMQQHWAAKVKSNVAWGLCFLVALASNFAQSGVPANWTDLTHLAASFTVILALTTQTYDKFWKPNGIAPAIEAATSSKVKSDAS